MSATEHIASAVDRFSAVVMVGSLGSLHAIEQVVRGLPADFPVPVLISRHGAHDGLAHILAWRTGCDVHAVRAGDSLPPRGVSVVPAGVGIDPTMSTQGPLRFGHATPTARPCDELLAAAAAQLGPRLIAVVLTGRLDDAACGVRATKRAGGRVIVQDPAQAQANGMPTAALATGCIDFVLPLHRIATALVALAMAPGGADLLTVPLSSWTAYA